MTGNMPVFARMSNNDIYDFVLLSVVDALLQEVYVRCGTQKREGRIEAMQHALETLQNTYKGYVPDTYLNRSTKFLRLLHTDLDSLLSGIKTIKE